MKFFAYSKKGSSEFLHASKCTASRAASVLRGCDSWRGMQPKGSNSTLEEYLKGLTPCKVEVTYE